MCIEHLRKGMELNLLVRLRQGEEGKERINAENAEDAEK
jgi:hypothetical protein